MNTSIPQRLAALRARMKTAGIDAYLIPSSDPHQSEYLAGHWKSREWISGFSGSAGTVIVTADHAGLWTDSRYFLQAEEEITGSGIELHRQIVPHAPEHVSWLAQQLPEGAAAGLDAYLFSETQIQHLQQHLQPKNIRLHTDLDLISDIWPDRPPLPQAPLYEHDPAFAGLTRLQKLGVIRKKMKELNAGAHLITSLDDIAWALNIRSADVDFNPVAYAYLLINPAKACLFVDEKKISGGIRQKLNNDGIMIIPYQEVLPYLEQLPAETSILADPSSTNARLMQALAGKNCIRGELIPRALKAVKHTTEIGHIRRVMIKDGVALTRLFRWLEAQHDAGNTPTEVEVGAQLARFRSEQDHYVGESFTAIVGYNANGAIIHYHPKPETCARIRREGLLLLDSGGQYLDGTTDITRTVALSEPSEAQKEHFTLVLKGYMALDRVQFPKGTTGGQLDAFARQYLWQHGLNYGHGTGHGVGFFLSVHEPPQGFAASVVTSRGSTVFAAGMLTSNEPGFYLPGKYGIRIENLMLCEERSTTDFGEFLGFEALTLFPIDTSLVKKEWLSVEEVSWLNAYHQKVEQALSPHLDKDEREWMAEKCKVLSVQ